MKRIVHIGYIMFGFILLNTKVADCITCLSCRNIADLSNCNEAIVCNATQTCFIEKVLSLVDFKPVYNTGCKELDYCKLQLCNKKAYGVGNSRKKQLDNDLTLCSECCFQESCNAEGCGYKQPSNNITQCFRCDEVYEGGPPCTRTEDCDLTQYACSVTNHPNSHFPGAYELGCNFKRAQCQLYVNLAGEQKDENVKCCDTTLCNPSPYNRKINKTLIEHDFKCPEGTIRPTTKPPLPPPTTTSTAFTPSMLNLTQSTTQPTKTSEKSTSLPATESTTTTPVPTTESTTTTPVPTTESTTTTPVPTTESTLPTTTTPTLPTTKSKVQTTATTTLPTTKSSVPLTTTTTLPTTKSTVPTTTTMTLPTTKSTVPTTTTTTLPTTKSTVPTTSTTTRPTTKSTVPTTTTTTLPTTKSTVPTTTTTTLSTAKSIVPTTTTKTLPTTISTVSTTTPTTLQTTKSTIPIPTTKTTTLAASTKTIPQVTKPLNNITHCFKCDEVYEGGQQCTTTEDCDLTLYACSVTNHPNSRYPGAYELGCKFKRAQCQLYVNLAGGQKDENVKCCDTTLCNPSPYNRKFNKTLIDFPAPTTITTTTLQTTKTSNPIPTTKTTTLAVTTSISPKTIPQVTMRSICPSHLTQRVPAEYIHLYGDKCYEFVPYVGGWMYARKDCHRKGGHMLSITNAGEQAFISNLISKGYVITTLWLGLDDRVNEGQFNWDTGVKVNYTNWAPGRNVDPYHDQRDCVVMIVARDGKWDDVDCDALVNGRLISYNWICQYNFETQVISTMPDKAVDGNWNHWHTWSTCSVTCGTGSQSRTRDCNNPAPQYGGIFCFGLRTETSTCNTKDCPPN